jgi:soluble lytic murein transglycosylase-like protein
MRTNGFRDVQPPAAAHPGPQARTELLKTVHYEATRAGLDPQLVLGVMEVESGFRKYAVSAPARAATCR